MPGTSTGIAGSPGQLADGTNPQYRAKVFDNGAQLERLDTVDQVATRHRLRTNGAGQASIAERDLLVAILREMRIQTLILAAGLNVSDDLDALRREPNLTLDTDESLHN